MSEDSPINEDGDVREDVLAVASHAPAPVAPPAEPVAVAPPPPEPDEPVTTVEKQGDSWLETIKTIVYALLIALVIRTFLFQPFNIPTGSMIATLLVGDYLFVEKFAYGYSKHSFPFSFMPFSGRVFGSSPAPGDVIVFKMPNPASDHYMEDYIKRVVGMPGDRIQVLNGVLYINDKAVPKVRVADFIEHDAIMGTTMPVPQFRETLPNGKSYLVLDRGTSDFDNTQVFIVPPGDYFMMGDNRDNSDDSRGNVGYVPFEDLVGRAELRFFSIDESAIWYEPWTWPGAIRFSRMFTLID